MLPVKRRLPGQERLDLKATRVKFSYPNTDFRNFAQRRGDSRVSFVPHFFFASLRLREIGFGDELTLPAREREWRLRLLHLDCPMLPLAPKNAGERKKQAQRVLRRLKADYGDAECALQFDSTAQLLIATILSAQCTDKRVNIVTTKLFADCPTAADIAALPIRRLEEYVRSTGFFRNKAKNIQACCRVLVEKYDGEVPKDLESLVQLAGVGRKTANVVLGTGLGIASGVVVDTHVGRISRRTGLTRQTDPVRVEKELSALLPRRRWVDFSHQMIYHGRQVCVARKPLCEKCSLRGFCPRTGVAPPAKTTNKAKR